MLREVLDGIRSGTVAPDLGPDVFRVVRTTSGPYADFVELRMRPVDDDLICAVAIDASQEHRLDAVLSHLASSTFIVDEGGTMIWRPFGNASRLEVSDEDALGVGTLEWIHPEDLPELLRLFTDLVASPGEIRVTTVRARQPYIEEGWVLTRLTGVNAVDDPAVRGIIVRSEEQGDVDRIASLSQTSGQFQSLAEAAPIGILVADRDGRVIYRNRLARDLLGDGPDGHWIEQARATHRDELEELVHEALDAQLQGSALVPFDRPDETVWLLITAMPQTDEDGRPFGLIATLQDMTAETTAREELRIAQDRLWHLANHDQLTGLPNRSLLLDRLDQTLHRHQREHHGVAILLGDLDGFKEVNDELGHLAGDEVLVQVARRISASVRATDTACRYGGDAFLVLCEGFDEPTEVEAVATRIIEAVRAPMMVASVPIEVGITFGIALADDAPSARTLLARADDAMYRAKAAGKGGYEVAG